MKKSLVVLLAVVFTLAIAGATLAADISVWSGGDMYFYFNNDQRGMLESPGTFTLLNITAQVTNGNTWAKFWLNEDKWRTYWNGNGQNWYFAFGANKIGDVLDLGFETKDNGNCNMGQASITDLFNTFHADPIFCSYPIEMWTAYAGLTLGNLVVKVDYNVGTPTAVWSTGNGTSGDGNGDYANAGDYAVTLTGKIDAGEIHAGYMNRGTNLYLAQVGGTFAIGDMNLKADIWKDTGVGNYSNDGGFESDLAVSVGTGAQFDLGFGNADFVLFFNNPRSVLYDNEIGAKLSYKMDKLTLCGEYFRNYVSGPAANDNAWQIYGLYNVGAFDVKVGVIDFGAADDTSLIVGFHAGIW